MKPASGPVRSRPSMGLRLAALVLLGVLPAALMLLVLLAVQYERAVDQLRTRATGTARSIAQMVDRELMQVQAGLTGLASSPLLTQGDLGAFHAQATLFKSQSPAHEIALVAPDGQLLMVTSRPFGQPLPMGSGQMRSVRDTGHGVVTDLFRGAVSGVPLVAVGVPVVRDGQVVFMLAATLSPQRIQALLESQELPEAWVGGIADGRRQYLARTGDASSFLGKPLRAELAARLAAQGEGAFEGTLADGTPVFTVFSHALRSGWTVALNIPRSELTRPQRTALLWFGLGTAVVLTIGLGLAWRMGHGVVESLDHLLQASVQLGRGQRVVVPPLAFEEAEQLGRALEHASLTLRQTTRDLGAKEARLRAVLESAMDAIVVADGDGRIVSFNAAASRLFGYYPEEVLGEPLERLMPERFRRDHQSKVGRYFDQMAEPRRLGTPARPVLGRRRDGSEIALEATMSAAEAGGEAILTAVLRPLERADDPAAAATQPIRV